MKPLVDEVQQGAIPAPANEPVHDYAPGSRERAALKEELLRQRAEVVDIPLIVGGREVRTSRTFDVTMPHDHGHVLARCHIAGAAEAQAAVDASRAAWAEPGAGLWLPRSTPVRCRQFSRPTSTPQISG